MTITKDSSSQAAAKKAPTTRKTSLYRLRCSGPVAEENLTSFVLAPYLGRDGFTSRPVDQDGIRGLLMTGTVAPGKADWCDPLGALTGQEVAEENRTAFGRLLVRSESAVYGLAYGMGFLIIDPALIDPGFGIEFAVRCLDEDRITKVRRQLMDARGRTDENSATSGEHIRGFGIEQFGEIVSKISGQITGVPLTFTKDRKRPAHITGSDRSVKLHLASTASGLMEDLQSIEEVCARPDPLSGLEFIAQVRPVNPKSDLALRLDAQLDAVIGGPDLSRIALAVPGECRDRFEFAECFKVTLAGSSEMYDELDAGQLVAVVRHKPDGERLPALRAGRVEMFADTEGAERLSRKVPADHWLTAEVSEGIVHYFYWQGQWYEIGAAWARALRSCRSPGLNPPGRTRRAHGGSGGEKRVGLGFFVERFGRQVNAVGPDDGACFRVDRYPGEVGGIVQRRQHARPVLGREVDIPSRAVAEQQAQHVITDHSDSCHDRQVGLVHGLYATPAARWPSGAHCAGPGPSS